MTSSRTTGREIAVIVGLNKDYDRRVVVGIGRYARQRGNWRLYLEEDPRARIPDTRTWRGHGIIAGCDNPHVGRAAAGLRVPVVGIGGFSEPKMVSRVLGRAIPYVATNNQAIGRLGAEYLISCGLPNFGFCSLPPTQYNSWARSRGAAFASSVRRAGFDCSVFAGRHGIARQWQAMQRELTDWVASLPIPAGIMACHDMRARHVLEACRRLGRRVPDQVAVLGVDNDLMLCEMSLPPLSTVEQDPERIGYVAAMMLDRLIGRRKVQPWVAVEPKGVVVRGSTEFTAVQDELVADALRYIRDNAAGSIRMSAILERFGVSRSALDARFKRVLRRTVYDEVQQVRLNTAKRLLASTDLPPKTIALKAGYRSDSYMAFVFRRDVGLAPGAYRAQQRRTT